MKPHQILLAAPVCLTLLLSITAQCTEQPPSESEIQSRVNEKLHFQSGDVMLPGQIAKLTLSDNFRYLSPEDADFVITQLWGNPPGAKTLGMIFARDVNPASQNGWGVIITYTDDGYIKDSDADSINYDKLLKQMQEGARKSNEERVKEGFTKVELVGWASRPRYEKETHKMYWAKELKFSDATANTLNYNIRVLGRAGVLNLNIVAGMEALSQVEAKAAEIVGLVNFTEGNRYADFNKSTDKVAAYGLAALVVGGIAAKAGLFKVVLAALIAAKKFVIIGVIALIALVKKIMLGRANKGA